MLELETCVLRYKLKSTVSHGYVLRCVIVTTVGVQFLFFYIMRFSMTQIIGVEVRVWDSLPQTKFCKNHRHRGYTALGQIYTKN